MYAKKPLSGNILAVFSLLGPFPFQPLFHLRNHMWGSLLEIVFPYLVTNNDVLVNVYQLAGGDGVREAYSIC